MSNKREKDRESGTGQPIKAIAPKGGSGKGNWGSDQDQINQAIDDKNNDSNSNRRRKRGKRDEPDSFAALNPDESTQQKQTWDEYLSKNKKKSGTKAYDKTTVKSDYRKKYKANKHEQETDALFSGSNKKKKNNRKKKKKKVLLQTQVFYQEREQPSRRGRGRGRYDNNMRGGGYQRGGGRGYGNRRGGGGGYGGQRGGGGYGGYNRRRGAGFGSRGRGSYNDNYDNNQNYQNQNQYQGNNNNQGSNNNAPQQNQDNVNIPVTVQ